MATPTENWPKGYLIELHDAAINAGMVFVRPISKADAESLRARFYRIRRRSDSSMAAFIRPEFHLVMVGRWEEANGGQLPIIFNKTADGSPLPSIVPATPEELAERAPSPVAAPRTVSDLSAPVSSIDLDSLDTGLAPEAIDSFIDSLRKKKTDD